MAESAGLLIAHLDEAIAGGRSFEAQLRSFAGHGDDDEVEDAFLTSAGQTRTRLERLTARLQQLGYAPSWDKTPLEGIYELAPKLSQADSVPEECVAQNLIAAYAIESAACAVYEALATVASAASDTQTESLARALQAQACEAAGRIFRFIPSRSKIAFNVLTPNVIDPAIETRAPDDRIL